VQEKVHHQGAAENEVRVIVVKRDGTRVPYDRARSCALQRACWNARWTTPRWTGGGPGRGHHLPQQRARGEPQYIGLVIATSATRQIAYVRFASVYRHFEDLGELINEAQDVIHSPSQQAPGQQSLFE